ncbi:hypothetical protein GNX71_23890 [Variovorax sp. RKNM96]|uniref:T6SS effector BTH_I2691 family protein n=1 Tax=Variovorax sp. RKNM96 TaxID=2681552 RepID=UPI001980794D|nr:T6SS effector BTH_I2691 family protein [Variovorax sp. RKNM96]QSI32461.1 hypothetical protein GNX71_23890 [Variovorax sp. RKNM96]
MACDPSKKCPICDQQGLVFLPVRYNLARTDGVLERASAPSLQSPFAASSVKIPGSSAELPIEGIELPASHAKYTLRLLREGYLYLYNEKRREWKGYVVSDDAHLVEYDMHSAPPKLAGAEPCARMATQQTGRYLVIPDAHRPDLLGNIWLAFSPIPWTKSTWDKHKLQTHREKHMRRIDAKAWAKSATAQPHLDALYGAKEQVAEFHLAHGYQTISRSEGRLSTPATVTVYAGNQPFDHGLSEWAPLTRMQVDAMVASARNAAGQINPEDKRPPPGLVALDDPIGMAADLNQLIIQQGLDWVAEPERKEKFESAQSVMALREAIKNGAVISEEASRKDAALMGRAVVGTLFGSAHTRQFIRPVQEWDDAWFKVEDESEVRRLGHEAWEKYQKHLKGRNAYETYLDTTYPGELKKLTDTVLRPLDAAFIAWLDSAILKQHMICNFDPKSVKDGMRYQEAAAAILTDALGRTAVFEHMGKLLQQDPEKSESLFVRAFVWNLDDAIKQWKAATEMAAEPADWKGMCGTLYNGLKDAIEKGAAGELEGAMSGAAKYIYKLAGPVTRMMGQVVDSLAGKAAMQMPHKLQLALLGAVARSGNPKMDLIDLSGYTHPKQATRALAGQLAVKAGMSSSQSLRSAARAGLEPGVSTDRITGGKLFKFNAIVLMDTEALDRMKSMVRPLNLESRVMRNVRADVAIRAVRVEDFDQLLYHSVGKLGGLEFKTGVVAVILAGASLPKLIDDQANAAPDAKIAKTTALIAGVTALLGNGIEVVGTLSKNLPWGSQKLALPMGRLMLNASTRAEMVVAGGKWLGAIGAFVAGALMTKEGIDDYSLNKSYGIVVGLLGVTTMGLALAVLFGIAVPFSIIAFVVIAIVTVVVGFFKPDDMERWLDKTLHWGKNANGKFSSMLEQGNAIKTLREAAQKAAREAAKAG